MCSVCIPRSFLVINVCNQGKTLCSPCTTNKMHLLSQIIYSCKTVYMFRTVFRPSSGAQNCVYINGICQTAAATCCLQRIKEQFWNKEGFALPFSMFSFLLIGVSNCVDISSHFSCLNLSSRWTAVVLQSTQEICVFSSSSSGSLVMHFTAMLLLRVPLT
jgi:hypothetical protein